MSMAKPENKLHIAFFPFLAFGHLSPYFELAKLIAQKGHRISFISTPRNIQRLPQLPMELANLIDLVSLPFPHDPTLPENAESSMDASPDKLSCIQKAYNRLEDSVALFLEANPQSLPDWIFYDLPTRWLPPVASKLGISHAYLSITLSLSQVFFGHKQSSEARRRNPLEFTVPPKWITFPSTVALRPYEVNIHVDHVKEMKNLVEADKASTFVPPFKACEAILIRSCLELEGEWLKLCSEIYKKPVVPVGLIPPSVVINGGDDKLNDKDENWGQINEWLSKQEKGSVVYVAFGTETKLNDDEITKLASGLEQSGLAFFWVLGKSTMRPNSDVGFEERTKGRGIIWTSWAPQQKILAHESIGGFFTHCGLSSIIEGLDFGRPLIMYPQTIVQSLDARLMEEKMVGREIPRDPKDGTFTSEGVAETLKEVVLRDEGKVYKENAREMGKLFANEDRHKQYIDGLIKFLKDHRSLHHLNK